MNTFKKVDQIRCDLGHNSTNDLSILVNIVINACRGALGSLGSKIVDNIFTIIGH